MTYRERRLRRAQQLRGWSASNESRSTQRGNVADAILELIPPGQPVLVGHHSEKRHRNDLKRIEDGIGAAVQLHDKAQRQASAANTIEEQAEHAIYDDDPDVLERLTEKIAALEAKRERMKLANTKYRKEHPELKAMTAYDRSQAVPYPPYSLSNLGGLISKTKERLARLQREREHGPTDRIIIARYDSECATCGAELERGQSIRYNRQQGAVRYLPGHRTGRTL
jgi:DNA repair exonuclease SbcCD ATPase subunit